MESRVDNLSQSVHKIKSLLIDFTFKNAGNIVSAVGGVADHVSVSTSNQMNYKDAPVKTLRGPARGRGPNSEVDFHFFLLFLRGEWHQPGIFFGMEKYLRMQT